MSARAETVMLSGLGEAGAPAAARGWSGGGSEEWHPALVHEKGSGGAEVKSRSCSAVGAKWGVWQASHPHSFSCVQAGQAFGGLGRMPDTGAVEVAWADVVHPVIWWQVVHSAEKRLSLARNLPY